MLIREFKDKPVVIHTKIVRGIVAEIEINCLVRVSLS